VDLYTDSAPDRNHRMSLIQLLSDYRGPGDGTEIRTSYVGGEGRGALWPHQYVADGLLGVMGEKVDFLAASSLG